MKGRYAVGTSVSPDRSRSEIERTCSRYGACEFVYGWQENKAVVGFSYKSSLGFRRVRFLLPLPAEGDVSTTASGRRRRGEGAKQRAREQETRRRWRALALAIKSKLETVSSGIAAFDDEFLAYVVLPGGGTVGERISPQIQIAMTSGDLPPLLLPAPTRKEPKR